MDFVEANSARLSKKSARIIVDHVRAATFVLGDEKALCQAMLGRDTFIRRLIRRAINHARKIAFDSKKFTMLADMFIQEYGEDYIDIKQNGQKVKDELLKEIEKFSKAIEEGHREYEKVYCRH